jgi:hypothetical protein
VPSSSQSNPAERTSYEPGEIALCGQRGVLGMAEAAKEHGLHSGQTDIASGGRIGPLGLKYSRGSGQRASRFSSCRRHGVLPVH